MHERHVLGLACWLAHAFWKHCWHFSGTSGEGPGDGPGEGGEGLGRGAGGEGLGRGAGPGGEGEGGDGPGEGEGGDGPGESPCPCACSTSAKNAKITSGTDLPPNSRVATWPAP